MDEPSYRILGPLEVDLGVGRIPIRGRQQRAILCLLLIHANRPLASEWIVEELWGDPLPARARKRLQVEVTRLRKALDAERHRLRSVNGGYALTVAPGDLDSAVFEAHVERASSCWAAGDPVAAADHADQALRLWRGPPLPDLADTASAGAEGRRLEALRLNALELRIDAHLRLGRHAALVPELEALVAADPTRERLAGRLMVALYRCERQAEALAVFGRVRSYLAGELGLEPGRALHALQAQILARSLPEEAWGTAAPRARVAQPLPEPLVRRAALLGRAPELAALRSDRADGRGLVVVTGDAGIGKSHVAAAFAAARHADGDLLLYGRCDEHTLLPFQPMVEGLRRLAAREPGLLTAGAQPDELRWLARLVPEVEGPGEPSAVSDPDERRRLLFQAVALCSERLARRRATVWVIDDLHWADLPTLLLMRELVRRLAGVPFMIVATARDREPATELAEIVTDLQAEGLGRRLPLDGLDDATTAELAVAAAGARLGPELRRAMRGLTGGNALFVEHLARALAGAAVLDARGAALEDALETVGVPLGIEAVLGRRLERAGSSVTRIVECAAVVGSEFRAELVAAALEVGLGAVVDALDVSVESGFLVELPEEPGRFAFAHALVRRTLLQRLTATRRAYLHLRVAEALPRDAQPAVLADHFHAARHVGGAARAVYASRAAAEASLQALAYEDAAAHYRRALEALELDPARVADARPELLLALADVCGRCGDIEASRAAALDACEAARALGDGRELFARAALRFSDWQRYGETDTAAIALLGEARAGLEEPALRARVLGMLAVRLDPARQDQREGLLREATGLARGVGDQAALVAVLAMTPTVLWRPEALVQRLAAAEEAVAIAGTGAGDEWALWGHTSRFVDLLELGRVADAAGALTAADRLATELREPYYRWYVTALAATLAAVRGQLDDAERWSADAAAMRREHDDGIDETRLVQAAMLARLRGDCRAGVEHADVLVERYPHIRLWRALRAALRAQAGDRQGARADRAAIEPLQALPRERDRLATVALLADAAPSAEEAGMLRAELAPYSGRHVLIDRAWGWWGMV